MYKIAVLGDSDSVLGFRALGLEACPVSDPEEGRQALHRMARENYAILYVTERSYRLYVEGRYPDYPLWVSMPVAAPVWRDWTFWQYSHTARLEGYYGSEGRIDLNVFRGSRDQFDAFGLAE